VGERHRRRRNRGVDTVEVARRRGGGVAARVGGADAGVDRMVGVGGEIAAGDVDAKRSAGDGAGIGIAVDRQGDGVAAVHVAADRTGDGDRSAGFGRVDGVVRGDGVDRNAGRCRGTDSVELARRRRRRVAGRVGGADAGVDGMVGIGSQIAAGDVDAEGSAGDGVGIGRAIHRQGDDVAAVDVAANRAGHRHGAAGLRCTNHVVGGDGVDRDAGRHRRVDTVEVGRRRCGRITRRVDGADAGVDGMVGVSREIAAGDIDAEGGAGDRTGIGRAVHRQGDGVAAVDVAADRAGHRDGAAGFRCVENVVGGDGVDRDAGRHRGVDTVEVGRRRGGRITRRVGGGDTGVDGMVGVSRQIAAGDIDAEGGAGDRTGIGGAVHCQGDGVAAVDVAANRAGHRHGRRRPLLR